MAARHAACQWNGSQRAALRAYRDRSCVGFFKTPFGRRSSACSHARVRRLLLSFTCARRDRPCQRLPWVLRLLALPIKILPTSSPPAGPPHGSYWHHRLPIQAALSFVRTLVYVQACEDVVWVSNRSLRRGGKCRCDEARHPGRLVQQGRGHQDELPGASAGALAEVHGHSKRGSPMKAACSEELVPPRWTGAGGRRRVKGRRGSHVGHQEQQDRDDWAPGHSPNCRSGWE